MFLLFVCVFSAGRGPNTSEAHRGGGRGRERDPVPTQSAERYCWLEKKARQV